jgi:acyl-CoA reductase-like NAD-dependent aldehyde dehydrogenase
MNTTFSLQDPDLFRQQAFVAGQWCDADNGATADVDNPATAEILGKVPYMGRAETRRAIEAAKNAWAEWRHLPARDRSAILRKWHDLMLANVDDLGKLMTAEQGKPLAEAKGEVAYAAGRIGKIHAGNFRAHFCHSAPMETHASGFRLRANAPEGQKPFFISQTSVALAEGTRR